MNCLLRFSNYFAVRGALFIYLLVIIIYLYSTGMSLFRFLLQAVV